MGEVEEKILRLFFEKNGFLVKRFSKEILLVVNPSFQKEVLEKRPAPFILFKKDLSSIGKAVVKYKLWHTLRFSKAVFNLDPEIFDFTKEKKKGETEKLLGGRYETILVIPELPKSKKLKEGTITFLKEKNVSHLLLFSFILQDLIRDVDLHLLYNTEPYLYIFKLLKYYHLLRDEQLKFPWPEKS